MNSAKLYNPDPLFFMEYAKHDSDHQMPHFHYHHAYELYILEEGYHHILINDAIHDVHAYDVALFRPNSFHKSLRNQLCVRTCVYFTEQFLRQYFTERSIRLLLKCFDQEVVSLRKDQFPRIKKLLLLLEKEEASKSDNRIFIYLADILTILNENGSMPGEAHSSFTHAKITPILTYIHQNYNKINKIEEIADRYYMSKYYLCRIFKEATGLTLLQYMTNIKVQNACNLLVNTDLSILDIATACGFNSSMYFCKTFKHALAVTPSEFRKQAL